MIDRDNFQAEKSFIAGIAGIEIIDPILRSVLSGAKGFFYIKACLCSSFCTWKPLLIKLNRRLIDIKQWEEKTQPVDPGFKMANNCSNWCLVFVS